MGRPSFPPAGGGCSRTSHDRKAGKRVISVLPRQSLKLAAQRNFGHSCAIWVCRLSGRLVESGVQSGDSKGLLLRGDEP